MTYTSYLFYIAQEGCTVTLPNAQKTAADQGDERYRCAKASPVRACQSSLLVSFTSRTRFNACALRSLSKVC